MQRVTTSSRSLGLGSLQLAVGVFCATISTLMLVAPHQLSAAAYAPIQPYLAWWGVAFLLAGCALISAAASIIRGLPALAAHLVGGALLLGLAAGFATTGTWAGVVNYGVLGLGTAIAGFLAQGSGAGGRGPDAEAPTTGQSQPELACAGHGARSPTTSQSHPGLVSGVSVPDPRPLTPDP
ncbi:MAG: hypothetical protein HY331_15585, partial [Chloroflexi bacterium]|nr:hypothetical protein [Chloroflexota bacterium]